MIRAPPMPKRSPRRSQRPSGVAPSSALGHGKPRLAVAVSTLLGVATFLALIAVDQRAAAAFDAPKRLAAVLGIAAACALAAVFGLLPSRLPPSRRQRLALGCAGAGLALAALSATLSPRPAAAFDTLRTMVLFAALAVLAGAAAVSAPLWRSVVRGFVAGAAVNAVASLLQRRGVVELFQYTAEGGRGFASAWVGNTGVLGLALALAAVLLLPALVRSRSTGQRLAGGALLALLLAGLIGSNSVTGVLALGGGAVVAALVLLPGRRWRLLAAAGAAAVGLALAASLILADRSAQTVNQLLTYRLAPWSAAVEMAAERPLLGWGAGGFRAEYPPHVMAAELRWETRLVNPHLSGSYAEAHNDVLQAMAELGLPATLLLLAAAGLAVWPLLRSPSADAGRAAVLATLTAGAVAAAAWFPLQRPAAAILLLVALGRAWRLAADREEAAEEAAEETGPRTAAPARSVPWWLRAVAVLAVALLARPDLPAYAAERRLAGVQVALQRVSGMPGGMQRSVALRRIAAEAAALDTYPGDERPANAAGMAAMLVGDPRRAADHFAGALADAERPELVANLGLARAASGDRDGAAAAMLRAAWVSPQMLPALESRSGLPLASTLRDLEQRLVAGELTAADLPPPPLAARTEPAQSAPGAAVSPTAASPAAAPAPAR